MEQSEVIARLEPALMKDGQGRYCLLCKKASVVFKLRGHSSQLRFVARDKIALRTESHGLTLEDSETGAVQRVVLWDDIECLMAGEPETDNGSLFQG